MDATAQRAIAIVGLGAILPDAPNVTTFWGNIVNKRYSIKQVPSHRWNAADYYDPDMSVPDKTYSLIGSWVEGFQFDWKKYRIPPKVAAAMDQGQQWAVTIADMALQDYGYPERPLNNERTAVIIGTAMGGELHYQTFLRLSFPEYVRALEQVEDFQHLPAEVREHIRDRWHEIIAHDLPPVTEDSMPGELPNIVSGRIANVLNLQGPNFITDAACAASFAAVNSAVELLTEHHVDAVITGGVDRNMGVTTFIKFCKIGALSATGSRPFGDGADGFVMGEGCAAFLLKRLEDAERAGDNIYAVIRGVGGSSDGKGKGITAPNPRGQDFAVQRAWENAGLDPTTATLVEAHGTSTRVGDVVEVESLSKIYGCAPLGSIGLGSIKSNIGHLKAGAGAAGLLKATLALHHKVLPPTLNAEHPNPNIDFSRTPFDLIHEPRDWQPNNGTPRRAGVSAYGFGGTNFHLVLEEYVPGRLTNGKRSFAAAKVPNVSEQAEDQSSAPSQPPSWSAPPRSEAPFRGILALGASTPHELKDKLDGILQRVESGWMPPRALPAPVELSQRERLVIDFGNHDELLNRLHIAQKAMGFDSIHAWKPFQAQGIFRGSGERPGKVAFLFPGQGSQYVNMGRELAALSPVVAEVFAEADRVMTPILGRPLTSYIFADGEDMAEAEMNLMQTAITQPAMLTLDVAILRLLESFGFQPDMVMGHSLGEYAALIASGVMPFADALEAAAARGSEMTKVSMDDNGWMAAVLAPYDVVEEILKQVHGYVVPANINSNSQCVIGGASKAVEQAIQLFTEQGYKAMQLPVSHAFHTRIVAPASDALRQVLDRLHVAPPTLPLVANATGDFYPTDTETIKDVLQQQIASPVQWVRGLSTLYDAAVRTFVEVGPKRALKSFVDDVFGDAPDVLSLLTNHPKVGELPTFNQALCGLYAAGYYAEPDEVAVTPPAEATPAENMEISEVDMANVTQMLMQAIQQAASQAPTRAYDRDEVPRGSVIISGTGLGLPGAEKNVMDPENALRILRGEQFVDLIPERFRKLMLAKRVTQLIKGDDGNNRFEPITASDRVIKLAGRPGKFDLEEEYGVPGKLIRALDITTQLAMAAGLDALREAGIPLVMTYRPTTTGKHLPERWMLPEALRDETGVIFASAFPGGDSFADEFSRYYSYQNRVEQLNTLQDLRLYTSDAPTLREIDRRINELREELERQPYEFDRRFIFRILAMGHSQFAEYVGARGPNTQVNAACASTTQAIALAEDWIRSGRCRRVIVLGADDVTSDHLLEWVGAGFLATGAAATDDRVEEAALPFDRRRHGTIIGMGACALVVESEDCVLERGMRGMVEVLSTETRNSAYHGTRLDVNHIAQVMDALVTSAERRFGLHRQAIAPQTVFMSHETFTPARGGSAAAEIVALRYTFGEAAKEIIIANTKGFTGHPMGVGVEDVIALKILEHGIVPPVPNFKEMDVELGELNLSRGGRYPVQYVLHLSAGFGSQIAMALTRRIPGALERVDNRLQYQRWLDSISGYDRAELEVEKRVLRIKMQGVPLRTPAPNTWQYGTGPTMRARAAAGGASAGDYPAHKAAPPTKEAVPSPAPQPVAPVPQPAPIMSTPAAPEPTPNGFDPVTMRVLEIVSAQTGYPSDMLDLDLDLEADLGVDTVKQAETFAAIRQEFDIPRRDDLKLRDYPTLRHVVGFVKEMRPDLAVEMPQAITVMAEEIIPAPSSPAPNAVENGFDAVTMRVLEIVAAQTGYPTDMLELDLDLEADLGVDTVKQAETFAAIRQEFDIPRRDDLKLRDYPTLRHVVGFVKEMQPSGFVGYDAAPVVEEAPAAPPADTGGVDIVTARVLAIVSEQTGYPSDMLDLDLDLEADLGVDTVKQAETFAAIRREFDIPRRDDLKLRDYPTLRHVVGFVKEMRPDLAGGTAPVPFEVAEGTDPAAPVPIAPPSPGGSLEDADRILRRVPVPALRPPLALCKPTGVTLDERSRVIVMLDSSGVGKALVDRLEKRGVTVLAFENADLSADAIQANVQAWLDDGAIQGVYWLPALDVEPNLETLELPEWRELNRQRVKNLYALMRALYEQINQPGTFLVSATRLGGLHGYGVEGASAPLGGAVVGFTKAYKRERGAALVKAVDFEISRKTAAYADALIAETLYDPGVVEVGYREDQRYSITLVEQPADYSEPGITLDNNTVFVITGAAGGITSAIVQDLASASGGIFYLLDLAPLPAADDPLVALFRESRDALKAELIEEARARGEKLTPVQIEKRIASIEREEAALRAVEAVQAYGGAAYYHSVNLLDGESLAQIVDDIRTQHGRIDVLIHAGGLEISRSLPDKDPAQFDLVYDVKADGFFSLLRAAQGMPIGATVVFSSVAGRFGNAGQTDYSAANDLLCKVTSSLKTWRPETRGIAIDWTAWGGIGMATRGSIPKIMEMAGIETLPPQSGVPTVRRELLAGGGEVVVGGKLGILMDECDETGGLDTEKVQGTLMAANVRGAFLYSGLQIETTLDPKVQPFLYDHAMEGTPLLPGVMGTEAFAEAARLFAPDFTVAAVTDERFESPFKFYRMEPQTLYISLLACPAEAGALTAYGTLSSRRQLANGATQEKVHFTAQVLLTPGPPQASPCPYTAPDTLPISAEDIYRVYFHGPAYRVLAGAVVEGDTAVGLLAQPLPAATSPEDAPLVMQPRLIELCFQTAGIWEIKTRGVMALPMALDSVTAFRAPDGSANLYAVVRALEDGARFDAWVVDEQGNLYVELLGYRTVQLPNQVAL